MDATGNYDLKVEFLEHNQSIDEEEEFRNFCMNIWVPGSTGERTPASIPAAAHNSESGTSSSSNSVVTSEKLAAKPVIPATIKRVKPTYVQSLRPETAHVPEDDVRLSYAKTFFNTFNGFEREELGQKLRSFCVDDCVMSVKWIGDKGNPCGPNYREVRGLESVASLLEAILVTAIPDAVCQLQDSKLRVKPDKTSYLLCKYTFSGTQVTRIEPVPALLPGYKEHSASSASQPATSSSSSSAAGAQAAVEPATKRQRGDSSYGAGAGAGAVAGSSKGGRAGGAASAKSRSASSGPGSGSKRAAPDSSAASQSEMYVDRIPMAATAMLPAMVKMTAVGTLIIHINAANKIYRFEYIQKVIRLVTL